MRQNWDVFSFEGQYGTVRIYSNSVCPEHWRRLRLLEEKPTYGVVFYFCFFAQHAFGTAPATLQWHCMGTTSMWKRNGLHWVHSPHSKVLTNLLPAPPARAHWHLPVPVPAANIVPTSRLLTYRSSHLISGTATNACLIKTKQTMLKTPGPRTCLMVLILMLRLSTVSWTGCLLEVFFSHILTILNICWHPFSN